VAGAAPAEGVVDADAFGDGSRAAISIATATTPTSTREMATAPNLVVKRGDVFPRVDLFKRMDFFSIDGPPLEPSG
jgi:hypothetical protein